jgi:hypothetical protein
MRWTCRQPYGVTRQAWSESKKRFVTKSRDEGALGVTEDDAAVWSWAWPESLLWLNDKPIRWMFPFVTGKGWAGWQGPGDIWGIDDQGELIIAELKKCNGETVDPFIDFLCLKNPLEGQVYDADQVRTAHPLGRTTDASALVDEWSKRLVQERAYIAAHLASYRAGKLPPNHTGVRNGPAFAGVMSYSSKRETAFAWRHLYLDHVVPDLLDPGRYEAFVRTALAVRLERGSPPPHYMALLMVGPKADAKLSSHGKAHLRRLSELVGSGRVHIRAMRGSPLAHDRVSVTSWVIPPG